jgi:tRNA/tmRNA/rRNA uracil-C5-methylase (TrmA/RlmC/RlmD family)
VGLHAGDRVELRIVDNAFGGEGVARVEDFVIFVPFSVEGELIQAEITEVKKRFARGKLVKILESSPDRREPVCRYFKQCGGCQYQHIAYEAQLRLKHKQVRDLFQRIGGLNGSILAPVVPCPEPYGYRNRIMIRSQWDKFKQGLNIGFLQAENRLVVDIEECKIAEPALNEEIRRVRANPPPKGGLKVVLRIPPEDWTVPPDSFFQNNFFLLPKLVETVQTMLRSGGTRHLADLYCGVGFFAIETAAQVESFVGLELDQMAIQAARTNASARGIKNGEFIAGAVEEKLLEVMARFEAPETSVLIDPPRKGCRRDTLDLLRTIQPAQVIYVSCDPSTMARDLNVLTANSVFNVAHVVPLDMFPQTAHVECVADLRLNAAASEPGEGSLPNPPE